MASLPGSAPLPSGPHHTGPQGQGSVLAGLGEREMRKRDRGRKTRREGGREEEKEGGIEEGREGGREGGRERGRR